MQARGQPCPPTIKLFQPVAGTGGISPHSRLSELYRRYFLPTCLQKGGRSQATVNEYETAIRYWIELTEPADPPLAAIDEEVCAGFVDALHDVESIHSTNTVRKHAVAVQSVLNATGPKTRKRPLNLGLFELPPLLPIPEGEDPLPEDSWTLSELEAWIEAVQRHAPEHPVVEGVDPVDWWVSLILCGYNTSLRIGTLLSLKWEWLARKDWGWLLSIPKARRAAARRNYKGNKRKQFPVNSYAVAALEAIRTERELIFPWTNRYGEPMRMPWLHTCRRRQLAAADLPAEKRHGFHGLRGTHASELDKIEPGLSSWSLGHAKTVARRSYVHPRILLGYLEQLPQPEVRRGPQQLELF